MASESRTSRLLVYSPRIDAYVDSVAAIVQTFHPDRIEFAFLYGGSGPPAPHRGQDRADFLAKIQKKLSEIGQEISAYREAESVDLIPISYSEQNIAAILEGTKSLDVTGAPKKLTVELVASALRIGNPKVYVLQWVSHYDGIESPRVSKDAYNYVDLTSLPSSRILRRSYLAQARLLIGMGISISAVAFVAALTHWIPSLMFANDILVTISVAAGFAGLYLAVRGEC